MMTLILVTQFCGVSQRNIMKFCTIQNDAQYMNT